MSVGLSDGLTDESIVAAASCLPLRSILGLSACCSRLELLARTDVLWLPLVERRWRFGTMPGHQEVLPPGARDRAAASALADARLAPLCGTAQNHAFKFYLNRCRHDDNLTIRLLQLDAVSLQPAVAKPEYVQRGSMVRIHGLEKEPQHNGATGVIMGPCPKGLDDRCAVMLAIPRLRRLAIRAQNLEVIRNPPASRQEAERYVMEGIGADSIDTLARLVNKSNQHDRTPGGLLERMAHQLLADTTEQWAVEQWQLLLADSARADLLEEGGLVVSQWADPGIADVAKARRQLAELAERVEARIPAHASLRQRVEAVGAVLFGEAGFTGNVDEYYDPRNSFLHTVLERKCGIPISLSILWAAVARRVAVPCFLCALMPAHVLVRVRMDGGDGPRDDLFVDAFGGHVMDHAAVVQFVVNRLGVGLREDFIAQKPATFVYARLLRNLVHIYLRNARDDNLVSLQRLAGACSQSIVVADPLFPQEADRLRAERERTRQRLVAADSSVSTIA
mmetsp:Transcript_45622/g.90498  ORF Transcript_45622/g.90498 Transcript_45622/m.90498 type:complete len:507 (-) Transcript_45622:103-1623(-)